MSRSRPHRESDIGGIIETGAHRSEPVREASPELLRRIASGEIGALGELYDLYAESVYGLAYRMSGSIQDAEDAVHDLFVELPESIRTLRDLDHFEIWFRRCAVRVILSSLRITRNRREVETLDPGWMDRTAGWQNERIDLEAALARIPKGMRAVIVLHEVEGFGHGEIAGMLGISPEASRMRLKRARQALRRLLSDRRGRWGYGGREGGKGP